MRADPCKVLAAERITTTIRGDVAVQLRRPWADGTTHLVFDGRDERDVAALPLLR